MPTLYVENVPEELYNAMRARAQENRTSISAEVLAMLAENVVTPSEIARRKALIEDLHKLRARRLPATGPFPSTEQMVREDRSR